ncbi:MAG: hypothetical protein ABIO57_02940 [Candidatus Paceibacterota bacterium]
MYEKSYHKTVLKTDVKPEQSKQRVNWKLILWLSLGAILIAGIIVLIKLPRLQINNIEVVGANVADPGDVTEFVKMELQGKKLFFLPKTSIILVPEHKLEKDLKAQFSRFQTVRVSRKNFSTLTVTVSEYQGVYLWCSDEENCYFMDQNGIAFAPAPVFSGSAYIKIFGGTVQPLPFQALSTAQNDRVTLLLTKLPAIMIVPTEFHFTSDHQLDVLFNHDGHQASIMFDPMADTQDALNVLFTGLRTNPLATKFHDSSKVLEYIDLRFSNRVVYKFQ